MNEERSAMPAGLHGQLERLFRPIEDLAEIIAGVMAVAAMLLVSADALLRYLFNAPLSFQYHLTENYVMVAMVMMPMAWGFRTGGYVRITGLIQPVPHAGRRLLIRAGLLVSAAYIAALAWVAGIQFLDAYQSDEVEFGVIDWPVAWSWVWVPVGLGLLTLRLLLAAFGPEGQLEIKHDAAEEAV
jgi:TRAP-type C4-dicarboxylate transport system permease small subunit